MLHDQAMPEQWIIQVEGREYGPADLDTLCEWKADGRVLPANPAREVDGDLWKTAGDVPGLFPVESPPVQFEDRGQRSEIRDQKKQGRPERLQPPVRILVSVL